MRLVVIALSVLGSGCASLAYYTQAAAGQVDIWRRQQPITQVLAQRNLPTRLRHKLQLVIAARAFAGQALGLADHGSYQSYVDVGRDYVVWNVFAAPELALTPLQSCYPLVGCVEYRGFFREARASAHAASLRAQGYDTFIGGVAAYSTLGWFHDPILSTVLRWDDVRIADTLFHELAHQRVYVAGDTTFNESFAMAVASAGIELWLAHDPARALRHRTEAAHEQAFIALVLGYRERLAAVFAGATPVALRRAQKQQLYEELRARYGDLKASWEGDDSYDAWMDHDLNNAKIASLAAYHDDVGAFLGLLHRCADDFPRFYAAVARLGALTPALRARCLNALGATSAAIAPDCSAVL